MINLIPAGLLSYKFEYIQIHPARPNREPCPEVVAVMDMEQLHGQAGEVDGNVSDESESLLSIGNGEDSIESDPAVDINENDMGKVFSSNHDMPVEDVKSAGHKRSCEVLKPQNKSVFFIGSFFETCENTKTLSLHFIELQQNEVAIE